MAAARRHFLPMIQLCSGSKVNLLLRVGPPGADGFHPLLTIFAALDLRERIQVELTEGPAIEIQVRGAELGDPEENLITRVLRRAPERLGLTPVGARVLLEKEVPHQAGLGGGSADAAAVLRLLWENSGRALSSGELSRLAAGFGSDVPFFLEGGYAVGRGRGAELEAISSSLVLPLLVVKPSMGVSTREAYETLDRSRPGKAPLGGTEERELASLRAVLEDPRSSPHDLVPWLGNDFHDLLVPRHPELREVAQALSRAGALAALLCGSGSALFGLFPDPGTRDEAAARLGRELPRSRVLPASTGVPGVLLGTEVLLGQPPRPDGA